MSEFRLPFVPKFPQSERIRILEERNARLGTDGSRQMGTYGDHHCWLDIGPFPHPDEIPSHKEGLEMTAEQWGKDYRFMLENTPPAIYPCETVVGEIYWEMAHFRPAGSGAWRKYPVAEEIAPLVKESERLGASPAAYGHTCPDVEILLNEGFDHLLARVRKSKALYEKLGNRRKVSYLRGLEDVALGCMHYIENYAALAKKLASETDDESEKARFEKISLASSHVAHKAPATFYEAVQTIQYAILFDRAVGHGNGYGRMDLWLQPYYDRDKAAGILTREEARETIAEMYMKLRGQFFSFAGRDENGKDATNEMSYIALEAYDLIGDYNNLGVMWHEDIDPDYYAYACDVLARHGESIPVLVNYDVMYDSEIRSGIPHEDAWKVVYSGCQWFCIPGKEWCGQDSNLVNLLRPFERAMDQAVEADVQDFETLYSLYEKEFHATMKAFQAAEGAIDRVRGESQPEMFTSLISHGPVERGMDMDAPRGVDYQYTSLNILGVPNVADSFTALKKLVFEEKRYTLKEVWEACKNDWKDSEIMRQRFLNQPKYGNGEEEPDEMVHRLSETTVEIAEGYYNQRGGQPMRPSLFAFMSHLEGRNSFGATPDGRHAGDQMAHGINPQAGVSKKGLIPMANSACAPDMRHFQGGSIQVDIQPRFFDGKEARYAYIRDFSAAFFKSGGQQINLHILDLKKLEDAMEHPEKPEYRNLVVRVTGYCARFITMSREYQEDFISRMNYASMS